MTTKTTPFQLDSDQLAAVEFMAEQDLRTGGSGGVLNASDTGAGKTACTCEVLNKLDVNTALIIVPLNTMDGWTNTLQERTTLPVYTINSTAKGKGNFTRLAQGDRGAYLVGREFMALSGSNLKPRLKNKQDVEENGAEPIFTKGRKALWAWAKVNKVLDVAVLDEGHSMSNRWGKGYAVLRELKPLALKVYLSATPFRSNFARAWAPTRWLWPDVIDRSQARWGAEWALYEYNAHKSGPVKMQISGEKNPGAFVKSLPCYVRLTYDKKPVELHRIKSSLTPEQANQYRQMLEKSFTWLEENPLVAELPIVKLTRLRQMLLGEVTFNEDDEIDFDPHCASDKIRQCIALAERHNGESIMFYCDSKRFSKVLAQRLTDVGQPSVAWNGDLSKKRRAEVKAKFVAGDPTVKHLCAVPAAIGEGSDQLQHRSHIETWVNKPFDSVIVQQTEGRLNRRGQPHTRIIRYELIVPGTVDEDDIARNIHKTRSMLGSL